MKPKRVDCFYCENILMDDVKMKASCKLGKRIMFRILGSGYQPREAGYFRYCAEFKNKTDEPNNN